VLLDEIEKAHPDVFNLLLQILEEGCLTDSFGRRVDFKNTVLIMTSNVGAKEIKGKKGMGFISEGSDAGYQQMKARVLEELRKVFNPEFLNRLDEIIVFRQLERNDLLQIIDILLKDLYKRLEAQKIEFEITPEAREFILEKGFNPDHGARPLKRAIQRYLEDPLSEKLLSGEMSRNDQLRITAEPGAAALSFEAVKKVQS
jgi:ATP-dependent Clp protease ATP-binding subunit ClpC